MNRKQSKSHCPYSQMIQKEIENQDAVFAKYHPNKFTFPSVINFKINSPNSVFAQTNQERTLQTELMNEEDNVIY